MDEKLLLRKVGGNFCRFIYKNYEFDEIANGKDMVMYCIGDKLLASIYIRENSFDVLLIFNKEEREIFESKRSEFPQNILLIYDKMKTLNDGKWIWIPVSDMETCEAVKKLILIKENPNRNPFPKDTAIYSKCGVRCDMCVYYLNGIHGEDSPEQIKIQQYLNRFWGDDTDFTTSCLGCSTKNTDDCKYLKHPKSKGLDSCLECDNYPCGDCGMIGLNPQAEGSRTAETLTWALLPYVGGLM